MAKMRILNNEEEIDDDVYAEFQSLTEGELIDFEKRCLLGEVQAVADDLDDMIIANKNSGKTLDVKKLVRLEHRLSEIVKKYT